MTTIPYVNCCLPGNGSGKWLTSRLTWSLHTDNLRPHVVRQLLRASNNAFRTWQRSSGLSFRRQPINQTADIIISFSPHTCCEFDGRGGTLAYAFLPVSNNPADARGNIHFDPAEWWTNSRLWARWTAAIHYETVLLHEIGHAVGLPHSGCMESIMYPSYSGPQTRLADADVVAVRALYGE